MRKCVWIKYNSNFCIHLFTNSKLFASGVPRQTTSDPSFLGLRLASRFFFGKVVLAEHVAGVCDFRTVQPCGTSTRCMHHGTAGMRAPVTRSLAARHGLRLADRCDGTMARVQFFLWITGIPGVHGRARPGGRAIKQLQQRYHQLRQHQL